MFAPCAESESAVKASTQQTATISIVLFIVILWIIARSPNVIVLLPASLQLPDIEDLPRVIRGVGADAFYGRCNL